MTYLNSLNHAALCRKNSVSSLRPTGMTTFWGRLPGFRQALLRTTIELGSGRMLNGTPPNFLMPVLTRRMSQAGPWSLQPPLPLLAGPLAKARLANLLMSTYTISRNRSTGRRGGRHC